MFEKDMISIGGGRAFFQYSFYEVAHAGAHPIMPHDS